MYLTRYGDRPRVDQDQHDKVIQMVKKKEWENLVNVEKVETNPDGETNRSAGQVRKGERIEDQYPDIVAISAKTHRPGIIGEIETEQSINENEAEQWSDYAILGINFYLYVPATKKDEAFQILVQKDLYKKIRSLRTYKVANESVDIGTVFENKS